MLDSDERQAIIDDEHLKMLSLGYLVSGIFSALMSMLGLFYAGMGVLLASMPPPESGSAHAGDPPPEFFGMLFGAFGAVIFVGLVALAIAKFMTASYLKKRRARTFCTVVAAISCLGMPWGTLLGVCTFVVLGRKSVAERFAAAA